MSINNDTVYSIANIDVSGGPVRFDVPDTPRPLLRAAVRRRLDEQLRLRRAPGDRHRGREAFCWSPPGWDGAGAGGRDRDPATDRGRHDRRPLGGGRRGTDMPAVGELQTGLRLTPTAAGQRAAGARPGRRRGSAVLRAAAGVDAGVSRRPSATAITSGGSSRSGLFGAESPYADAGPELADALRAGLQNARQTLEDALEQCRAPAQNGWDLTYHVVRLQPRLLRGRRARRRSVEAARRPARYMMRAGSARGGLWGNHGYEAAYAMVLRRRRRQRARRLASYELRFASAIRRATRSGR